MPNIVTQDAKAIAKKLERKKSKIDGRNSFTVTRKQGSDHEIIRVFYSDTFIGRYGIQRGSRQKLHNYIAEQLHLSRKQGFDLAECSFSIDDFINVLIEKNEIPEEV